MEMGLYLTQVQKALCWPWGEAGLASDSPFPSLGTLPQCPRTFRSPHGSQLLSLLLQQTPFCLQTKPSSWLGTWGPRMLGRRAIEDTLLHHSPGYHQELSLQCSANVRSYCDRSKPRPLLPSVPGGGY